MRKFYTLEEFRNTKKGIEKEYLDRVFPSKANSERIKMLFGQHCKVPNDFIQEKLNQRGFLYDPVGDNVEQTLCCFDIYSVEIPQNPDIDSDIDRFISNIRNERNLDSLRWELAVHADTAIDAIKKYAKIAGLTKDGDNPYLYIRENKILQNGGNKIVYFEKYAIFAK